MDADAGRSRVAVSDTPDKPRGKSMLAAAAAAIGLGVVADGIKAVKASVVAAMDPPKPARKRAPVWAGYAPIGITPVTHARRKEPVVVTFVTHIERGKVYPYASERQNTRAALKSAKFREQFGTGYIPAVAA